MAPREGFLSDENIEKICKAQKHEWLVEKGLQKLPKQNIASTVLSQNIVDIPPAIAASEELNYDNLVETVTDAPQSIDLADDDEGEGEEGAALLEAQVEDIVMRGRTAAARARAARALERRKLYKYF